MRGGHGCPPERDGGGQDGFVLGFIVVVLGVGFVAIGVNAMFGDPARRARPPVAGVGTGQPPSRGTRRVVAAAWVVLGVLFVVAAFTHQVP